MLRLFVMKRIEYCFSTLVRRCILGNGVRGYHLRRSSTFLWRTSSRDVCRGASCSLLLLVFLEAVFLVLPEDTEPRRGCCLVRLHSCGLKETDYTTRCECD